MRSEMHQVQAPPHALASSSDALDVVAFDIGAQRYGVNIQAVREIRAWSGAARVPGAHEFVRGVMNLRGAVIPVVDMRARFGQGATEATPSHVVIVVAVAEKWSGLLVDRVSDIVSLLRAEIQSPPDSLGAKDAMIEGLVALDGEMLALLSLDALFPD